MRANLLSKDGSSRGPRARKILIGVAIALGIVFFILLVTPLGGLLMGAADSVLGGEVTSRRQYRGAITEEQNGAGLSVGDRCDLEVRAEDRLFGEMVKLTLMCGGQALYGREEELGWIMETTKRDGEIVHALDQWDDEGDPGIEFALDDAKVVYWDNTGRRLKIAIEGLLGAGMPSEYDPAYLPTEKAAPAGADAAGAMATPAPMVSEKCEPGIVCWGPRMDIRM